MKSPSTAALTRFAAICGFLVAPSAALAQLRCDKEGSEVRIRSVKFVGNETFGADELALHVVSTPSDVSERIPRKQKMAIGAGLGAAVGALIGKNDRAGWAIGGAAIGTGVGYLIGNVIGTARCIRPGLLSGDMSNLRAFYYDQGFPDTRVDTATAMTGEQVDITFRIVEGQAVLVDSLNLAGYDSLELGPLPARLNSSVGSRYSSVRMQSDIDSLETRLRNSGYPLGQVLRNVTFPNSRYRAVVGFTFAPGPRARIGRVTIEDVGINGRPRAVSEAAIRDLLRFVPGDTYSERALFETERGFYRVGSFLSAEVAPDVSHAAGDSLVDVTVKLTEDLPRVFTVEPGYGTLDCLRLRTGYTDKAFLQGLNRLDFTGSVSKLGRARPWPGVSDFCKLTQNGEPADDISSSAVNYNATVQLTRPVTLRGGLLPSFSAYTERRGGYQAYLRTTLIGGAVSVSKNVTRSIFWQESYNLEFGHTQASESVLCFLFLACDQSARDQLTEGDKRLAVLGTRFARDRRNNPDSTTAGSFARLELRSSNHVILSDRSLEFNKAVVDAAWYRRALGPTVIAARFRFGVVAGGTELNDRKLPPPQERLFTGGETSVRGFQQNELGPLVYVTDDTTKLSTPGLTPEARLDSLQTLRMRVIPAGGNAMFVGNLEYRFPGPLVPRLQAILFIDVGSLSTSGPRTLLDSGSVRWTPGVAFRYFSPIGPIQVNLGYNHYQRADGPVYFDRFDPTSGLASKLICVSGTDADGQCQSVAAIPRPSSFWKRLTLTVAFPPDF